MPVGLEPHILFGRRIAPGTKGMSKLSMKALSTGAISKHAICYIVASTEGAYVTTAAASAATALQARGKLFISKFAVSGAGQEVELLPFGVIENVDTSGGSAGDPVYLGASGGFSLTKTGFARRVGYITRAHATLGEIFFEGSQPSGASNILAGTATLASGSSSVTITAATLGGAFGGKPVVAMLNAADGVALRIRTAAWSGDDLVLTAEGLAGANRTVSYMIAVD